MRFCRWMLLSLLSIAKAKKGLVPLWAFLWEWGAVPVFTSGFISFCSLFDPYQILENTPENHPDHSNLKLALERAEELCSQVNEGVREKENSDRLEWIQSHVQCEGLAEVATLIRCTAGAFPSHFRKAGGGNGSPCSHPFLERHPLLSSWQRSFY